MLPFESWNRESREETNRQRYGDGFASSYPVISGPLCRQHKSLGMFRGSSNDFEGSSISVTKSECLSPSGIFKAIYKFQQVAEGSFRISPNCPIAKAFIRTQH